MMGWMDGWDGRRARGIGAYESTDVYGWLGGLGRGKDSVILFLKVIYSDGRNTNDTQ